ncbi:transcriptional regulator [Brevundimonas sp.]|uniref:helix-turn-helix domain-containing protein n=1 Tax=Brevundimonas sp. TaxID=1871086 RepID=UPI002E1073AA|nr:transcriptional regulator [Brevundimonas sp.]
MTELHIIRDDAQYDAYLAEYEGFFDHEPARGSAEADRFETLGLLLARYEEERFPLDPPDPVEAIRFAMERKGMGQSDLATLIGSRSRASEILNRRRELTLEQMRLLNGVWGIPSQALLGSIAAA